MVYRLRGILSMVSVNVSYSLLYYGYFVHSLQETLKSYKLLVLLSLIYRFNPNLNPGSYFMDMDKQILKLLWRNKRPRIANTILKKNKVEGLILPNFRT